MISKFLVQSQYAQPIMMAQSLFNLSVQSFADAKPKKKARKPKPKVEMPPVNPHQDGEVSQMRSIIASRLTQAKQEIPHFYIGRIVKMDAALKARKRLLEEKKIKVSVNDMIVKATAMACFDVKEINSYWMGTKIRQFENADVSVAVDTPKGLITPIVFQANKLSIDQISNKVKELAKKARDNKLMPFEFQGGTITVSNLGMFGVDAFTGIINPPQASLLAVGQSSQVVVPDPKDKTKFKVQTQMWAYLCGDHRIVDGAKGAIWIDKFASYLEKPEKMITF